MHKNVAHDKCEVKALCTELQKLGYADTVNWIAVVLFVRNIVTELSVLNDNQKKEVQRVIFNKLATKDPSRKNFMSVIHGIEKVIVDNDTTASLQSELESYKQYSDSLSKAITLFASDSLAAEKDKVSLVTKFGAEALEGLSAKDPADTLIPRLRNLVTNMLEHYRDEAQKWEQKAKRLEQVVNVDPMLTTVHNRRALDSHLTEAIRKAEAEGTPLSLLMLDIDNFKKDINDVHGHLAGDDILRTLAKILTIHASNNNAFAARYGGDEFVLVCNISGDEAQLHADAIRYAVQNYEFRPRVDKKLSDDVIRFTVSVGLAEYQKGWTAEHFLKAADQAMYHVKRRGKNSVSRFRLAEPVRARHAHNPPAHAGQAGAHPG